MTDDKANGTVETLREWMKAACFDPKAYDALETLSMFENVVDVLDDVLKRLARLEERLDTKEGDS